VYAVLHKTIMHDNASFYAFTMTAEWREETQLKR